MLTAGGWGGGEPGIFCSFCKFTIIYRHQTCISILCYYRVGMLCCRKCQNFSSSFNSFQSDWTDKDWIRRSVHQSLLWNCSNRQNFSQIFKLPRNHVLFFLQRKVSQYVHSICFKMAFIHWIYLNSSIWVSITLALQSKSKILSISSWEWHPWTFQSHWNREMWKWIQ